MDKIKTLRTLISTRKTEIEQIYQCIELADSNYTAGMIKLVKNKTKELDNLLDELKQLTK